MQLAGGAWGVQQQAVLGGLRGPAGTTFTLFDKITKSVELATKRPDDQLALDVGTVFGMATRKVTLSLDQTAYALAESAAARAGMSTSAWLSAAARREAVRLGAGSDWGDHHAEALADDADLAAAEAELRAAG